MQCMLNFSGEDTKELVKFLKKFPGKEAATSFELLRCEIGESKVTLYESGKLLIQGRDCERVKEKVLQAVKFDDAEILGVDEAGRGESFGPFVVAGVLARPSAMRELRDSKKVKGVEEKREIVEERAGGIAVLSVGSKELWELHEKGITLNDIEAAAINIWHGLLKESGEKFRVVVDGKPLKNCNKDVQFLVKGDDLNPVIGAASVIAKSVRLNSKDDGKREGWGGWGKRKGK